MQVQGGLRRGSKDNLVFDSLGCLGVGHTFTLSRSPFRLTFPLTACQERAESWGRAARHSKQLLCEQEAVGQIPGCEEGSGSSLLVGCRTSTPLADSRWK